MNSRMKAPLLITSVAARPPGTNSRSQRSISASRLVRAKNSPPSLSISPPGSEATIATVPGMREKIVCGPVKSSCVMPG